MKMLSRRGLITGLISLAAAPAIVRASSLMPVKVMEPALTMEQLLALRIADAERIMREAMARCLYGDRLVWVDERQPATLQVSDKLDPFVHKELALSFSYEAIHGR